MNEYDKVVITRYKQVADLLQALGINSKSISYDKISVQLNKEWLVMSLKQANDLAERIIEEKNVYM